MASRNVKVPKMMNKDILDMSNKKFNDMMGISDLKRDKNGFVVLTPSAKKIDSDSAHLKTDILSLEDKLREYRKKHEKVEKLKETDNYKESKKKFSKKKNKKAKQHLLEMVFNNAEGDDESEVIDPNEDDNDEENYRDIKKKGSKKKSDKPKSTKLDTVYGQRFTPVVSLLHDSITEFDQLADEIRADLDNSKSSAKTMYRSSQMGNLISAKKSKLDAIKELAAVAKTVTDIEYKKEKDTRSENGNNNKAISALGAKYLRGSWGFDDDDDSSKKDKKKKKMKSLAARAKAHEDDDDDGYSEMSLEHKKNNQALAEEFAKTLVEKKADFKLTAHERFINMEGKYKFVIVADPGDVEGTWEFVAVDPKDEKKIKGFRDKYKDLYPSKKKCRMVFDLGKMRVTDRNTARTYKLILKS